MPELPEVETVVRRLRAGLHGERPLIGHRVVVVDVVDPQVVRSGAISSLAGAVVIDVTRRAKWITLHTDRGAKLLVHLKMTGDLHVVDAVEAKAARFVRLRLVLDDGRSLLFTDPRRFGHVDVADDLAAFFADLGPEPLDPSFTVAVLASRLQGQRSIKATLLDQTAVAGLGNIYADEALHAAKIDPRRPTSSLAETEIKALHRAIQDVLNDSIAEAEKELAWRYENRDTPSPFKVYERAGLPCLTCGTTLASTSLGGRMTVWCPSCQR
ncbi:MAG: bifunctional DNA-formamidopyrimidine glycosylase/DNA-(apurinic or apyrimidinic site) lyase [Deltaproteobacteria bacterium]|nr:bifunctional DNA-formamidopyrimidine glycosylase/DNA-(apurinic or apyrimidinic site) lyase [Deltaproteobacteria bacterium]